MDHFHPAVEKGQTLRDLKREKTEVIGKSEQDKLIINHGLSQTTKIHQYYQFNWVNIHFNTL